LSHTKGWTPGLRYHPGSERRCCASPSACGNWNGRSSSGG
jgi:hypothetical protein